MVKPFPQFSLEGNLFYVQSLKAEQYSKRDLEDIRNTTELRHVSNQIIQANANQDVDEEDLPFLVKRADNRKSKVKPVPAHKFVAFWFGVMGACLQRA